MYIPKYDTQNSLFYRLELLVETFWHLTWHKSTNQYSLKVPKGVKPTNKKTFLTTFGACVINSTLSPSFLTILTKQKIQGKIIWILIRKHSIRKIVLTFYYSIYICKHYVIYFVLFDL